MNAARPSRASLLLRLLFEDTQLATATGFLVRFVDGVYLVTNWHVVSGKDPDTGLALQPEFAAIPDRIGVMHNMSDEAAAWHETIEPLYDNAGQPLWFEHELLSDRRVDVVALPLGNAPDELVVIGHDPFAPPTMNVAVADQVSIIGFPFGVTAGGGFHAVWTQGTIASEPEVDFDDLPVFLVDSRTRHGMSGAPVIAYSHGGVRRNEDHSATLGGPPVEMFLGIYAGRINPESDLGRVWKGSVLRKILQDLRRGEMS